jgi:hypothetical protein
MFYQFFCTGILPTGKTQRLHWTGLIKVRYTSEGVDRRYVAGDNGNIMTGVV